MATRKDSVASTNTPEKKVPEKKAAAGKAPVKKPPATAKAPAKPPVRSAPARAPKPPPKKSKKDRKDKIVRDSFTMPQSEYRKIAEIKEACLKAGLRVKKSEVLRAGLKVLGAQSAAEWKQSLSGLAKIRTGRPKKR